MNKIVTVIRISIWIRFIIALLLLFDFAFTNTIMAVIHRTPVRVAVRAMVNDADSLLDNTDNYVAMLPIFAKEDDEVAIKMERDAAIYHAEITTYADESIGGLRFYRDGRFIGGTSILLRQSAPSATTVYFSDDGMIEGVAYDYMDLTKWMNASIIAERALSFNPFDFVPQDTSLYTKGWEKVTDYKVNVIWPKFRNKVLEGMNVPEEAENWIMNNILIRFATQCILPYVYGAKLPANVETEEPPMEAYSFLDSINYDPSVLLKYPTSLPLRDLVNAIIKYPYGGMELIDDSTVEEWMTLVDRQLAGAMKCRPKYFLQLLAAMSYIHQIEEGRMLNFEQISNLNKGLPKDIVDIVLQYNHNAARNNTTLLNLNDSAFTLDEFVEQNYSETPVVVDLWNTWCGPCKLAMNKCKDLTQSYESSNICFIYLCDESSPVSIWKIEATKIGGIHIRISRDDMDKLLKRHGLIGFPGYLFFDEKK